MSSGMRRAAGMASLLRGPYKGASFQRHWQSYFSRKAMCHNVLCHLSVLCGCLRYLNASLVALDPHVWARELYFGCQLSLELNHRTTFKHICPIFRVLIWNWMPTRLYCMFSQLSLLLFSQHLLTFQNIFWAIYWLREQKVWSTDIVIKRSYTQCKV